MTNIKVFLQLPLPCPLHDLNSLNSHENKYLQAKFNFNFINRNWGDETVREQQGCLLPRNESIQLKKLRYVIKGRRNRKAKART